MEKQNSSEDEKQTESLLDLQVTDEQAEETKAGLGDERYVYVFIGTRD